MILAVASLVAALAQTPLASPFIDWDALTVKPTAKGESRAVTDAPTPTLTRFEFHITTLRPGVESHPPHHHPQEEIIVLKTGTLDVSLNGRKTRAREGDVLFYASHDVHNVVNVGEVPATYYVINFHTRATAAVRNQPAAEWAPSNLLPSSVIAWDRLVPKPTATGSRRDLVDAPTVTFSRLEIHATTLNSHAPAAKLHRHPWVELVIVKDGSLEARVGSETHAIKAGSAFFVGSNVDQSYGNPSAEPVTYYVIAVVSAEALGPVSKA